MTLYRVHMQAARSPRFPEGSTSHFYEFVVPLDDNKILDAEAWQKHQEDCWVHRYWQGEPEQRGLLRHTDQGWVVDFDPTTEAEDEPFFKLGDHRLEQGDYLSILEQDDELQTFLIVSVQPYLLSDLKAGE